MAKRKYSIAEKTQHRKKLIEGFKKNLSDFSEKEKKIFDEIEQKVKEQEAKIADRNNLEAKAQQMTNEIDKLEDAIAKLETKAESAVISTYSATDIKLKEFDMTPRGHQRKNKPKTGE